MCSVCLHHSATSNTWCAYSSSRPAPTTATYSYWIALQPFNTHPDLIDIPVCAPFLPPLSMYIPPDISAQKTTLLIITSTQILRENVTPLLTGGQRGPWAGHGLDRGGQVRPPGPPPWLRRDGRHPVRHGQRAQLQPQGPLVA